MNSRLVAVLAVLAIGGAVAVDAVSPPEPPGGGRERHPVAAGVLACPFGSAGGARAAVYLANVGSSISRARVTVVPRRGEPVSVGRSLEPGGVARVRLHERVRGSASAIVEYAGGEIVASHALVLRGGRSGAGTGGAACARAGPDNALIAGLRTLDAESRLAVVNPGAAAADVSISLLADGEPIRPERLSRRVIPPRARREFRLGDFAFDTKNLTAVVRATTGRVVAEGLLSSGRGVSLHSSQQPARAPVAAAGVSGERTGLSVTAVGEEDSGIDSRLLTESSQGKAPDLPGSLEPGRGRRVSIPSRGGGSAAAYAFTVTVGSPLVAATTWERGRRGGDRASADAAEPAGRWAGVVGSSAEGFRARAVLVNPAGGPANVRLRRMDDRGETTVERTIPAGRLDVVRLGTGAGTFALEVEADAGVVVVLEGTSSTGGPGTIAMTATALRAPLAVAPRADPRAGVPAPVPT